MHHQGVSNEYPHYTLFGEQCVTKSSSLRGPLVIRRLVTLGGSPRFTKQATFVNSCLFSIVLRFYGPVNLLGSCRSRLVYLTTRFFLGSKRLTSIVQFFFRQNLTTAILDSAEGREWPQKILHDKAPRKKVARPGGDRTGDFLISSRTGNWLSHRGRLFDFLYNSPLQKKVYPKTKAFPLSLFPSRGGGGGGQMFSCRLHPFLEGLQK